MAAPLRGNRDPSLRATDLTAKAADGRAVGNLGQTVAMGAIAPIVARAEPVVRSAATTRLVPAVGMIGTRLPAVPSLRSNPNR